MPSTASPLYSRDQLEDMFLPINQMLQIDRVCTVEQGYLSCEMDVDNHWVFPMHFPNDPIFPGSLIIEAAGQAVAIWGWHKGLRGRPRLVKVEARFESPVLPQDRTITLQATVGQRKNICLGEVDVFVTERKIANIKAMIIIAPD